MTSGPTRTKSQRRAAGQRRVEVWLDAATAARLDELCEDSGYARTDMIAGMIDAEHDSMVEAKSSKARPGK